MTERPRHGPAHDRGQGPADRKSADRKSAGWLTGRPAAPGAPAAATARTGEPHLLPDVSPDETDLGWGELPPGAADDDDRILRELPPHHVG